MKLTNLKTKFLGKNNKFYKEIDSTQSEIWRLIEEEKIQNGQLIFADIQTKGKGTHGRVWHTDEENNIAFSFYIETDCETEKLEGITIRIAEILVDIFKKKYGISLNIKEPNDLVYNSKKIGGILTESRINSEKIKYLVIGIGINTNKTNFNDEIKDIASSIKKEFCIDVNREEIIEEFCFQFEAEIMRRLEK